MFGKGTFSNNPFKQGAVISLTAVLLMLLLEILPGGIYWNWKIAAAALLFYTVASGIFSIKQTDFKTYILKSATTYLLMISLLIGVAWLLSGNEKEQIRYYKIIFPCLLLFYLMLIGLATLLRNLLKFVSGNNPEDFFDQAGDRKSSSKSS